MAEFPVHPDGVTKEWLTDITGRRIASVAWEPIGTGQVGDSARFHCTDADGHGFTLAGKFPAADPTSRGTAAMFNLYRKEVEFYRKAAPALGVRVPHVHFADVADNGADFVLLFEDLGPARGGDQIAGCSIEDARAAMIQAAAIHAPSWSRADILDARWLDPPPDLRERLGAMYPHAQAVFRERYADALAPELMAVCEGLSDASALWFARDDAPQCLIHGDFRLDNMLFDIRGGAETIAILDWQTVASGRAMTDIGYFLVCGIGELGIAHEDELLDLYLAEMRGRGVDLTRENTRRDYRLGALHGVSTAVFSAAFVERTERGDANFLSMARGACGMALHLDSLGALTGAD